MVLTAHKNYEDSARISDYYGVCSRKISGVVTELRTRERSINNCAIVNNYTGTQFFRNNYCVCGTAYYTRQILFPRMFALPASHSTVLG